MPGRVGGGGVPASPGMPVVRAFVSTPVRPDQSFFVPSTPLATLFGIVAAWTPAPQQPVPGAPIAAWVSNDKATPQGPRPVPGAWFATPDRTQQPEQSAAWLPSVDNPVPRAPTEPFWRPAVEGPFQRLPPVASFAGTIDDPPRRFPVSVPTAWWDAPSRAQSAPPVAALITVPVAAQPPWTQPQTPAAWFAPVPMPPVLEDVAHFAGSVDNPPLRRGYQPPWTEPTWPMQARASVVPPSVDSPPTRAPVQPFWTPAAPWAAQRQGPVAAFAPSVDPPPSRAPQQPFWRPADGWGAQRAAPVAAFAGSIDNPPPKARALPPQLDAGWPAQALRPTVVVSVDAPPRARPPMPPRSWWDLQAQMPAQRRATVIPPPPVAQPFVPFRRQQIPVGWWSVDPFQHLAAYNVADMAMFTVEYPELSMFRKYYENSSYSLKPGRPMAKFRSSTWVRTFFTSYITIDEG